ALIAVLSALLVLPRADERIGDGLGVLVTLDDADAIERSARTVDKALPARGTRVGNVRQIRVGNGAHPGAGRGAVACAVAGAEPWRRRTVWRAHDDLHVGPGGREMRGGFARFGCELPLRRP